MKKLLSCILSLAVIFTILISIVSCSNGTKRVKMVSGSMEPTIPVSSTVYYKEVDPKDLLIGDIIVYKMSEDIVVTHRIIEVISDESDPDAVCFRTQGDANYTADADLVYPKDILGKVVKWEENFLDGIGDIFN